MSNLKQPLIILYKESNQAQVENTVSELLIYVFVKNQYDYN